MLAFVVKTDMVYFDLEIAKLWSYWQSGR